MSCNIFKGIINFNDKPIRVIKEEEEMKTSKEMQLKIIDKMRENVEGGNGLLKDIQYKNMDTNGWDGDIYDVSDRHFEKLEMRVKPQTITINGVEIPKPLDENERYAHGNLYEPCSNNDLYRTIFKVNYPYYNKDSLLYSSPLEAIEASKLLFGIEE